jgi:Phasin protein
MDKVSRTASCIELFLFRNLLNGERVMMDLSGTTDLMRNVIQGSDLMRNIMQTTQNYNAKVLEFASANCNANVDYLTRLARIKSPSEFIELTTSHMRVQADAMTWQARELTEMTQQLLPTAGHASS